jgi:hypothetical protein
LIIEGLGKFVVELFKLERQGREGGKKFSKFVLNKELKGK